MKLSLTSVIVLLLSFASPIEAQDGSWFQRLWNRGPGQYERMHESVLKAFRPVSEKISQSTVEIRVVGSKDPVALGTVVGSAGRIVTKSSQLADDAVLECRLKNGETYAARVVRRDDSHDLAILEIKATGLTPVQWNLEAPPTVGSWVVSSYTGDLPLAVGVVSVDSRKVGPNRAFLGIRHGGDNYTIEQVIDGSAAQAAGIQVGDVLKSLNGQSLDDPDDLGEVLAELAPGDVVTIDVEREGAGLSLSAILKEREQQSVNRNSSRRGSFRRRLEGSLSDRRTSFPSVLQHDTVLLPSYCGGPLVDLDGRVVGINIARAGRVNSYAVPAPTVVEFITEVDEAALTAAPVEETVVRLGKIERDLSELNEVMTLMRRLLQLENQITTLETELIAAEIGERATVEQSLRRARETADRVRASLRK